MVKMVPVKTKEKPDKLLKEWADKINSLWQKAAEAYITCGKELIKAKASMGHGKWEKFRDEPDYLAFGPETTSRLMKIAKNPILTKTAHARLLPPSWYTLYELTKLPDNILSKAVKEGDVHPNMERSDAEELVEKLKPKPKVERSRVAEDAEVVDDENEEDGAEADEDEEKEEKPVKSKPVPAKSAIAKSPKKPIEQHLENLEGGIDSLFEFFEVIGEDVEKHSIEKLPKELSTKIRNLHALLGRWMKKA